MPGPVFGTDGIVRDILDELDRADESYEPINSIHEGYAVILDELDAFWQEVRRPTRNGDVQQMRTELIQTAAMCVRTIRDAIDG